MNRGALDALVNEQLRAAGAEYVALAGYMRILSDDFVAQWAGRMVNIHPSLLPLYKGLNTHSQAIEAGDRFGGCSVHIVTPGIRSEEHTSELQSLMRISYADFCLKKKK